MDYKKLNIVTGWVVFLIAAFVYVSTIEPTASFWDCGEFIATAFKLEVGHPPGAPLFMMLGRVFSMFSAPENAAKMINIMSALSSAFTILFLFWTITALAKKIFVSAKEELSQANTIAILGSGIIGGLAYTFSDSFWFSAVEGEVYAMSSLFTAIVFWAILKWEAVSDEPGANKWLVLIAYLMGLSIGVHLLNLLAIPAITFVYYFKKHKVTQKGILLTFIISIAILAGIQYVIVPWTIKMASLFELFFVNSMGMPFNSGSVVYAFILIGAIVYGLLWTHKNGKVVLNTIIMCVTVILIGYSTFGIIIIRSSADTPMDENNPENVFTLLSYLNREQYGDRPLGYGPYFNSPQDRTEPYKDGTPVYFKDKEKGKYIVSDDKKKSVPNYPSEFKAIFPRMYSPEKRHVRAYKSWSNFKGRPVRYGDKTINKPTFAENMRFFFSYQVNWMYFRYFMWNFAGRQNDVQGHGNITDGNWISGIPFVDEFRLGNQSQLTDHQKTDPSNNKFYLLPFILGLIGLFFQFSRNKSDGIIVGLLFLFTGMAIVVYLNQYPFQPRERDYAYAASFYAFAIWIGLGVLGVYSFLRDKINPKTGAILATVVSLAIPGIMASEGWDDHDRSDTYTARDFAKNYLKTCAPNAVIFTNGDNDTFPLWYVQEVEGFRTDVRVINLSLLNTDWYINQMRRAAYKSAPVPFKMKEVQYRQGTRNYLPVFDKNKSKSFVNVKDVMKFILSPRAKVQLTSNRSSNYFPTKKYSLKVDKNKVMGFVPDNFKNKVVNQLEWTINKNYIMKNEMMMLDLLANNDWERPIYFAITTGNDSYIGLQKYFQLEGLAYRLVPFKTKSVDGQTGLVNSAIMYDNLMNKYVWGGMEKSTIYMNENNRRMCMNLRNNFSRLSETLIREAKLAAKNGNTVLANSKKEKAIAVLDKCLNVMPERNVPYNFFMMPVAEAYYKAGAIKKGDALLKRLSEIYEQECNYYFSLDREHYALIKKQSQQAVSVMYRLNLLATQFNAKGEITKELSDKFMQIQSIFEAKRGV